MQPGVVEAAADERRAADRVEVREHADTVDEHHVGIADARTALDVAEARERHAVLRRPLLDCAEVPGCRLVRRDDEPRVRVLAPDGEPRLEQHRLVARPRASSDEREALAHERRDVRRAAVDRVRAAPRLVEARVAGDRDAVGARA